jgi:ketosteroid isomerase-like protein
MTAAVDIVTEVCRRFADDEDPFELLADDVVWEVPMFDHDESFHGHLGVAEFFRRWLGTWEGYEFELEEMHPCTDGRVVTLFTERGRGRGSGVPVEIRPLGVWTVADGKVVAYRGYMDRDEGLRDSNVCFAPDVNGLD